MSGKSVKHYKINFNYNASRYNSTPRSINTLQIARHYSKVLSEGNGKGSIYRQMYETVTGFFCLKLKISINTEPIGFSILCELHVGSVMVLGFFYILEIKRY